MSARSDIAVSLAMPRTIRWETASTPVDYPKALARMEMEVADIAAGQAQELVWLLEHPPLYTAGTSAHAADLVDAERFPVFKTGRGGQYTYHGPGQRVAYVMLNIKDRGGDIRAFVARLEDWLIATLADFGVAGERREDRVGVWVSTSQGERKIAALGIRIKSGVSLHGISLNVAPDLSHFDGIVPCGISDYGVTSLADLGISANMDDLDESLKRNFSKLFGG